MEKYEIKVSDREEQKIKSNDVDRNKKKKKKYKMGHILKQEL